MPSTPSTVVRAHAHSFVAAVAALVVLAGSAAAQSEPIVTDRPDFTESTSVVPRGMLQVEGGYTFERAGAVHTHAIGEVLGRVGLLDALELRIGLNSYTITSVAGGSSTGVEDASLGVKLGLLRRDGHGAAFPEAALIVATGLPTGGSAVTAGGWEPEAKLALGWDLSERLGVAANLNAASLHGNGGRTGELAGSVSFGYSLTDRIGSYAEYYGFYPTSGPGADTHFANAGLTYLLTDDFQVDARVGHNLGSPEGDYFFGIGLARRWGHR